MLRQCHLAQCKGIKTAALPTVVSKIIARANETETLPLLLDAK